jgi:hypothetical protein
MSMLIGNLDISSELEDTSTDRDSEATKKAKLVFAGVLRGGYMKDMAGAPYIRIAEDGQWEVKADGPIMG